MNPPKVQSVVNSYSDFVTAADRLKARMKSLETSTDWSLAKKTIAGWRKMLNKSHSPADQLVSWSEDPDPKRIPAQAENYLGNLCLYDPVNDLEDSPVTAMVPDEVAGDVNWSQTEGARAGGLILQFRERSYGELKESLEEIHDMVFLLLSAVISQFDSALSTVEHSIEWHGDMNPGEDLRRFKKCLLDTSNAVDKAAGSCQRQGLVLAHEEIDDSTDWVSDCLSAMFLLESLEGRIQYTSFVGYDDWDDRDLALTHLTADESGARYYGLFGDYMTKDSLALAVSGIQRALVQDNLGAAANSLAGASETLSKLRRSLEYGSDEWYGVEL